MGDDHKMQRVDFDKQGGTINKITRQLMQDVDVMYKKRLERMARSRRNAKITAGLLTGGLVSIYFYSMYAVRQETFLDALDNEVLQQKAKQN